MRKLKADIELALNNAGFKSEFITQNAKDRNNFIELAHYLSEINALHPFREGNGRVQRIFISHLSQAAGYQLDYSDLEQAQIYKAMNPSLQNSF